MGLLERPDNYTALLLLFAATWRVTHLLMYEAGPFHIIQRLRGATGVKHDSDTGRPIAWPDGSVFECFWCLSVWVSIGMIPVAIWAWPVVLVLAISAVVIGIESYGTR